MLTSTKAPCYFITQNSIAAPRAILHAPCSGEVSTLDQHSNPILTTPLSGPGVSIKLSTHAIVAPVDGMLEEVAFCSTKYVFQSKQGKKVWLEIDLPEPNPDAIRGLVLTPQAVTKGQALAYIDLRQFQSPVHLAMIVTNTAPDAKWVFCHHQISAQEPLMYLL